ncbi:hypothetical protein FRC17_010730 [Serendipita sp. 399]|nr:hypothetical protein FRC17_010730 [Serendipita sp. 399]
MPRRPAPTPLRLHPGPTPPRNWPKFTMPLMPPQSFYPTTTTSVPDLKYEVKYFRRRGHTRTPSSSSVSSTDSEDVDQTPGTATPPTGYTSVRSSADGTTATTASVTASTHLSQGMPETMTRGPRRSTDMGGFTMPDYKSPPMRPNVVRSIEMMGPWEHSKLKLSEAEIAAMITAPKPAIPNPCPAWLSEQQENAASIPPDGRSMSPPQTSDISSGGSPPPLNPQALSNLPGSPAGGSDDDIIPTAIVIKNIPFNVKRETLLDIIASLSIPTPYAFNYHLDTAGQFRGLAFANFRVAADADAVVAALNGFDVQGRKLRVEYKKVLQASEKERIEREKALRRMRSMQLGKERQEQLVQQQQQQQMMNAGMGVGVGYDDGYSPIAQPMLTSQRSFTAGMTIQNPNPFAMPPMPVPQPYVHQPSVSPVQQPPPPPPPHSSSGAHKAPMTVAELDLNDAATLEIYSRILLFKDDHMRDELAFARSLSPKQRRIVHLVAQKLGVYHYSVGEGDERYAVVTRSPPDRSGSAHPPSVTSGAIENGRKTPNASETNPREGRLGPVRHHSSQALNRSFLVGSTPTTGGGSLFSNAPSSYATPAPSGNSPTADSPGGLRSKKSMPDMKTSIYTPTPRLTTRTSSGNMREGGPTNFSNYAALRRQTSGVLPGLNQLFGNHLLGNNLPRASISGALGDRPMSGLNGHATDGNIPPVPSLPSTPEGGPTGSATLNSSAAGVMRQPRGPGASSGGNFARRRESAIGPLDRLSSNSGLDARTHEPLDI